MEQKELMTIWTSTDNVWSAHRSYLLNQVWPDVFTFVALVISALVSSSFAMSSLSLLLCKTHFEFIWEGAVQNIFCSIYIFLEYICVCFVSKFVWFAIFGNPNSENTPFLLVTEKSKANALSTSLQTIPKDLQHEFGAGRTPKTSSIVHIFTKKFIINLIENTIEIQL